MLRNIRQQTEEERGKWEEERGAKAQLEVNVIFRKCVFGVDVRVLQTKTKLQYLTSMSHAKVVQ